MSDACQGDFERRAAYAAREIERRTREVLAYWGLEIDGTLTGTLGDRRGGEGSAPLSVRFGPHEGHR